MSFNIFAGEGKGPLWGKNYYVPFLPFYSFPGVDAAPGKKQDLNINLSQYFVQEMVVEYQVGSGLERLLDYEGYVLEPTVSYNISDSIEIGLTTRFHFYYGGIYDSVVEAFHGLFNFPNGGRSYYPQDEVYISFHTDSGIDFSLDSSKAAWGESDLFGKWSFFSRSYMDLALFAALKIPTGKMASISGSGYMDIAFAILSDFHITSWLSLYIQNGIILPGQLFFNDRTSPVPMYSLLTSIEFILSPVFSLVTQFRLVTSPYNTGSVIREDTSSSLIFHKPMTNIMVGLVMDVSDFRLQFYFEEDPFTNNGADLILNISVSKSFNLLK